MSGEPWLGNGPDSVPEAARPAPMADNWRPPRGPRAKVIAPRPDEHAAMLSASATILSTTPGRLSRPPCFARACARSAQPGWVPLLHPGRSSMQALAGSPRIRIAAHQADPGGLRAVRENAMRFWQGQQDPLSLLRPAPSAQRPQAQPQPPRTLYGALPLPPSRVFALARCRPWQTPMASAPPRIVEAVRKRYEPGLELESWLSEQQIVVRGEERHPLGLISLQGLPLLERNTSHSHAPWPSRTSTSVVWGNVARAIRLGQARSVGGCSVKEGPAPRFPAAKHDVPASQDSGISLSSSSDDEPAWEAEAAACALRMAARRRECPDMNRLDDLLRGLIPKPSARHPHPPHAYPTRPQKSELHPYGIHRALLRTRG